MKRLVIFLVGLASRILPMPLKQWLYRSTLLAHIIRFGLNLAAPKGLTIIDVASGKLHGLKLALDLKSEKDYWLGTYEPELQSAIADFVQPGDVAYDVGANIGFISLLMARYVGEEGKVFAFEALPQNQLRLFENIRINKYGQRIVVIKAAVIDKARPVRFLIGPSNGTGKVEGSAGRDGLQYEDSIVVTGTSLDQFVYLAGRPAPRIIKLDIEGGEILALPGMQRLLQQARPILLLELHGPEAIQIALQIFEQTSYRLYHMNPGYPPVPSLDTLHWKAYLVALPLTLAQNKQQILKTQTKDLKDIH